MKNKYRKIFKYVLEESVNSNGNSQADYNNEIGLYTFHYRIKNTLMKFSFYDFTIIPILIKIKVSVFNICEGVFKELFSDEFYFKMLPFGKNYKRIKNITKEAKKDVEYEKNNKLNRIICDMPLSKRSLYNGENGVKTVPPTSADAPPPPARQK